jgi:hypothetical protein
MWAVDDEGVPVEVKCRDPPTAAGDARHLGERTLLVGDVHEHPLGAAGIEGGVIEVERLGVAHPKLDRQPAVVPAPPSLGDERLAHVDSNHPSTGSDQSRDVDDVRASAAADVEHDVTGTQLQTLEDERLTGLDGCQRISLIEKAGKKRGILAPVNGREQRHVLHGPSRLRRRHVQLRSPRQRQRPPFWIIRAPESISGPRAWWTVIYVVDEDRTLALRGPRVLFCLGIRPRARRFCPYVR